MEDLLLYTKGTDKSLDRDFSEKKKFGDVYYHQNFLFTKKGIKWFYYPLANIFEIELISGSRQLRQCCGAPIYQTKVLLITTTNQERIYLTVEEINNKDLKRTETLLEVIALNDNNIKIKQNK